MKFIVDVPSYKDVTDMVDRMCGLNDSSFMLADKNRMFSVAEHKELQPPPEVKKIETGVLNIPSTTYIGLMPHTNAMFYSGNKVDLSMYPELKPLCKDIETIWDFSSIPDKALVDIVFGDNVRVVGWITEESSVCFRIKNWTKGDGLFVEKKDIKSIRIVESAK